MLSPQAMLGRLEQRLPLLTGGARDLPARQQTLRNAIAWSYDLLDPEEQTLFRRLAVFADGVSFEAAEAVANPNGELDIFGSLERLLEHSLIRQEVGLEGEPRFTMLETIREFGLEQLEESGEAEAVRQRHADFFLGLTERTESELRGPRQSLWLDRLESDLDNLRAALEWALHADQEAALRLATALFWFWYSRHPNEGQAWLDRALAGGEATPTALRARALGRVASLTWMQGDYDRAATLDEEALLAAREAGALAEAAYALVDLGLVELNRGDRLRAAALLDDGLRQYRELGDEWGTALALNCRAEVLRAEGNYARALAYYEEAGVLFTRLGDRLGTALTSLNIGDAAHHQGQPARAVAALEEALRAADGLGDQRLVGGALIGLAMVAGALPKWVAQAARLLGAGDARLAEAGITLEQVDRESYEDALAAARTALGEQAFAAAYQEGRALPPDQAIAEALAAADRVAASSAVG
jgi:non-specific serine/threonine protein kinase